MKTAIQSQVELLPMEGRRPARLMRLTVEAGIGIRPGEAER